MLDRLANEPDAAERERRAAELIGRARELVPRSSAPAPASSAGVACRMTCSMRCMTRGCSAC
jgi:hypothetical protein